MNRYALLVAAMAATFVGGCASTDTKKTADAQTAEPEDKVQVTGSRIPRRVQPTGSATVYSTEGQDAQDTLRNLPPNIPPSKGR